MAQIQSLLLMLLFLSWFHNLPVLEAQTNLPPTMAPRTLDSLLQYFAYRAFVNPKSGIHYNATVPSRLTGINATAMRLRTGSFQRRGVQNYYEFRIPTGVSVTPYVERLALVYHNFGKRSAEFYPLPGFRFIAPVLGLLAYDATNLTSVDVPELSITAFRDPISIAFRDTDPIWEGSHAMCVRFDAHSLAYFSNVGEGKTCSTVQLGHFSIVTESVTPAPTPVLSPPAPTPRLALPVPTESVAPPPSFATVLSQTTTAERVFLVVGGIIAAAICLHLFVKWCRRKCQESDC